MFAIRNYKGMLFSQVQKSIFYTYLVKNSKYKCTIKQIMFGKKTELTSDPKDSKKDAEFDVSIKFLNLTKKIVQNLDNRKKKINSYIQRKRILAKKHSDHVIVNSPGFIPHIQKYIPNKKIHVFPNGVEVVNF